MVPSGLKFSEEENGRQLTNHRHSAADVKHTFHKVASICIPQHQKNYDAKDDQSIPPRSQIRYFCGRLSFKLAPPWPSCAAVVPCKRRDILRSGTTVSSVTVAAKNSELTPVYQVHNPGWASEDLCSQNADIDLSKWDGAAETIFDETIPEDIDGIREEYHPKVILADERRFLKDEALKHGKPVEPGTVIGERIEFIVDGRPVVSDSSWQEWRALWQTYVNKHGDGS